MVQDSEIREAVVVGLISIIVYLTVCLCFGFAWTFRSAVEAPEKIRHAFTRTS